MPQSDHRPERADAIMAGPLPDSSKGSLKHCWQVVSLLHASWDARAMGEANWERHLGVIQEYRMWEKIPPEQPYGSLDALLRAELKVSEAAILAELHRLRSEARHLQGALPAKAEQAYGKGKAGPGRGQKTGDNITRLSRGTSAAYRLQILKRDHPDVAAAYARGAYRSVRAAEIAAGVFTPLTRLEQAQRAYQRLTPDEQAQFRGWLDAVIQGVVGPNASR
jgi:hypothetical protein